MRPLLRALAVVFPTAISAAVVPLAAGQASPASPPAGAKADYHVHVKGGLTLDEALRRSRQNGITYGIVVNGGLGFPIDNDAGLEAFLRETRGKAAFVAFQAEGREWVRLFTRPTLEKFDYVFTDSMTWTGEDGRRMRLWIPEEVGTIADPQKFMDTLVDRATGIFANEPIDLYVNPTFLPEQLAPDYDRLWTPARMKRIVDGLAAAGIGMEINNRYRIPSAAFVRLAKKSGVKFACGTNNAGADDLRGNEYCEQMIRECGLGAGDFWTPPAEGHKAVQRRPLVPGRHSRAAARPAAAQNRLPRLQVHPGGRYIVRPDGTPFLYLADTAWELFHRPTREEVRQYLDVRAAQGFTAVQAVALAELEGIDEPNAYGDLPLVERDPARPAVTPGANPDDPGEYDYWDNVDFVVDEANSRGLCVAFLPAWGRWVGGRPRDEGLITAGNAQAYGEFLGRRYGKKAIVWVLGGDRPGEGFEEVWRAMARGIAIGVSGREDYGQVLMSYHPTGDQTSSAWFHGDGWLDFNMQQTGHGPAAGVRSWEKIAADYARTPAKPVVDGEPLYEDHPIGFSRGVRQNGFSSDNHVRQRAYWALFAGAAGVTYGNHAVWQWYAPGRRPVNGPLYFWDEAIHRPGAGQVRHVRTLIESRPMLSRVPDQSLVVDPLEGPERIQAMRGPDHLFVYTGSGIAFTLNMGRISGSRVKAFWYNPRNGTSTEAGTFENGGTREFKPQYEGLGSDWVLVLDDEAAGYPAPGRLVAAPPHSR